MELSLKAEHLSHFVAVLFPFLFENVKCCFPVIFYHNLNLLSELVSFRTHFFKTSYLKTVLQFPSEEIALGSFEHVHSL